METTKLHYLQVSFNSLPAGTPVYECEPSGAQVFANALVRRDAEPARYFIVAGEKSENSIMRVPSFKGTVGEVHPRDKTVVGPFVTGGISVDCDKLGRDVSVLVTAQRNYTFVDVKVIVEPDITYEDSVYSLHTSGMGTDECDLMFGASLESTVLTVVKAILFSDKVEPVPGFKMDSSVRELMALVVNKHRFITG